MKRALNRKAEDILARAAAVLARHPRRITATLAAVPSVPIESLALLVGIDRLMSQCRSFTNLIGNGVATVVISRWEKEITPELLNANLRQLAVNNFAVK